jgi:hypothetical protein
MIVFIQGLGSAIEQGCLSSTVSQWVSNMDQVNWVGIKGVPLARSDWMASCVSDCESGLVKGSLITVRGSVLSYVNDLWCMRA